MSAKTVLITGCSEGGIGHALALEWHKHGHRVFATARNTKAMSELAEAGIECFAMDVTEPDSLTAIKEQVEKVSGGTLDILVNNAGQGTTPPSPLGANWQATRFRFWILTLMLQRGCTMSTCGASSAPPKHSPRSSSPHKAQSSSSAPSPESCPTSTEVPALQTPQIVLMCRSIQFEQSSNQLDRRHPPRRNVPLQRPRAQHCNRRRANQPLPQNAQKPRSQTPRHVPLSPHRGIL